MAEQESILGKLRALFSKHEGVEDLLRMCSSYDGYKRENAVRRLGRIGNPLALPKLIERANDWVPQVRSAAKEAIKILATQENAKAYVYCLPDLYRLKTCGRDNHAELISFVERYITSEVNSSNVIEGIRSSISSVSKHCAHLSIEHRLLGTEALIYMGISHSDVTARLRAARLIPALAGESRRKALVAALGNSFMPVRRKAILEILKEGPEERSVVRYLFDPHASIRQLVATQYADWSRPVIDLYKSKVASPNRRESRIMAWGIGEYGESEDAALLLPLLKSTYPQVRKQALASVAKLIGQESKAHLLHGLEDSSDPVANEAARISVRLGLRPNADELIAIVGKGDTQTMLSRCLIAIRRSNKWERLVFMLQALSLAPDQQEILLGALGQWNQEFNKSHTQPTSAQAKTLVDLLSLCSSLLGEGIAKSLSFTLRQF